MHLSLKLQCVRSQIWTKQHKIEKHWGLPTAWQQHANNNHTTYQILLDGYLNTWLTAWLAHYGGVGQWQWHVSQMAAGNAVVGKIMERNHSALTKYNYHTLSNTLKCVYCCCARLALFVPPVCFSHQCKWVWIIFHWCRLMKWVW